MAEVRRATAADVDALVEMGRAMHAESPRYRDKTFSADKLRQLAAHLSAHPEQGAVLVAAGPDGAVGMFVGILGERWFGTDRYATDLAVYVKPEHRGTSAFLRLVRAAERWAAECGVEEIDLGVSTGTDTEHTVHAYQRLGYTLLATRVVTKKLNHVHRH